MTTDFSYATASLFLFNPLPYAPNSHFLYVGGVLPFRFPSSNPSISKFPFLSFLLQRNICVYSSLPHSSFMSCHSFILSFLLPFFLSLPLISTRCRFRGLLLQLIAFNKIHTHTHTRWDSSGRGIGLSQTRLPDNTQHSQETDNHAPGGIRTPNGQRPHALDHVATGIGCITSCFNNLA